MIHPKRDTHSWLISVFVFCGVALFLCGIVLTQPEIVESMRSAGLHGVAPETVKSIPQWLFICASAFVVAGAFMDVRRRFG